MPTIFLVEDNSGDVNLFRMALQHAEVDCELTVFEDGREIIDYLRKPETTGTRSAPDLIVLDLNLPKSDGLEVLQATKDVPGFEKVPFVVMSSSSSPRERSQLAAFPIWEYIVKPADLDEYLKIGDVIRKLLGQTRDGESTPS